MKGRKRAKCAFSPYGVSQTEQLHQILKQASVSNNHSKSSFLLIFISQQVGEALRFAPEGRLFIIQNERERKTKSHQRQHQLHIKKFSGEQWSCHEHHLCLPAEPRSQSLTNHWGQSSRMDEQSAASII